MLRRLIHIMTRTRDDAGSPVRVTGAEPPHARRVARESARALWVSRNTWFTLIAIQLACVAVLAVALNTGINVLTDFLERSGFTSAPISRRAAFLGIISLQALSFAAIVSTILVFRPAWLFARARQRVAAGLCGSCAYDLRGAISESTGLTTCPECGAQWNTARERPTPKQWIRGVTT